MRKLLSLATVFQCAVAITTLMLAAPVVAQAPPTAQNIIPDGISYATQGKIPALDPGAGTLTITPEISRRSRWQWLQVSVLATWRMATWPASTTPAR